MAKDVIVKAIETILSGTPAGIARSAPKKLQNLLKKTEKAKGITGKPKGKSPSMVLGSASKAGMQKKQKSPFNVKVTSTNVRRPNRLDNQRRRLAPGSGPRRKS